MSNVTFRMTIEANAGGQTDEAALERASVMLRELQDKWPSTVLVTVEREHSYWIGIDKEIDRVPSLDSIESVLRPS